MYILKDKKILCISNENFNNQRIKEKLGLKSALCIKKVVETLICLKNNYI